MTTVEHICALQHTHDNDNLREVSTWILNTLTDLANDADDKSGEIIFADPITEIIDDDESDSLISFLYRRYQEGDMPCSFVDLFQAIIASAGLDYGIQRYLPHHEKALRLWLVELHGRAFIDNHRFIGYRIADAPYKDFTFEQGGD